MPKSSLNAAHLKHSIATLTSWSPPCPFYKTNILISMPQTLALDLTATTSVTATLANAILATATAIATIANVTHTFNL
jgi:hypothetical protein